MDVALFVFENYDESCRWSRVDMNSVAGNKNDIKNC